MINTLQGLFKIAIVVSTTQPLLGYVAKKKRNKQTRFVILSIGDHYVRHGHHSRRDDRDYRYHREPRRSLSSRRYHDSSRDRYNDDEWSDWYDSRSDDRSRSRGSLAEDPGDDPILVEPNDTVSGDTNGKEKNATSAGSQIIPDIANSNPERDSQTQTTAPAPTADTTVVTTPLNAGEESLDQAVLQIIGDRLKPERVILPAIHKDLAVRVEEIINKGLPSEEKKTLLQKFPPPQNGLFMDPPKLNFEIKTNIPDSIVKRDDRIVEKQSRISASLASITKLMSTTLQLFQDQKLAMLEILGGGSRILADLQHEESEIRRSLILKNIDPSKRDILKSTASSELLFGGNLEEKFKAARLLESTANKLKPAAKPSSNNEPKNSKRPSRRLPYKSHHNSTTSGQKSTSSQKLYRNHKQTKKNHSQTRK